MAETVNPSNEQRQTFDDIPTERVFLDIKLYLTDDDTPGGQMMYHGDRLKALKVSPITAAECKLIYQLANRNIQQAINTAGQSRDVTNLLRSILGDDDDDESNSNEGSGDGEGLPTDSNSSVPGDGEGGPVRSVGREENAANSPSD